MRKTIVANVVGVLLLISCSRSNAQHHLDSLFIGRDSIAVMDSIMKDLDFFLDSISLRKSFFNVNVSAANGLYSFKADNSVFLQSVSRLVLSPSISYFNKSGLGLSATGYGMVDNSSFNFYQLAISPSFIFLKNKNFATGISYAHYFTKDSLSFFTTPVDNEIYGFFTLKKYWIEPTVAAGFGWGSKTEYEKQYYFVQRQRARRRGWVIQQTTQSVKDYLLSFSVRHNFNFFHLLTAKDFLQVTPMFMLTAGTQNFGFNTSYSSNLKVISNNYLPSNNEITDNRGLGFQSTSFILRLDYTIRKFYIQPQLLLDYYLPETDEKKFNYIVAVAAGFNF